LDWTGQARFTSGCGPLVVKNQIACGFCCGRHSDKPTPRRAKRPVCNDASVGVAHCCDSGSTPLYVVRATARDTCLATGCKTANDSRDRTTEKMQHMCCTKNHSTHTTACGRAAAIYLEHRLAHLRLYYAYSVGVTMHSILTSVCQSVWDRMSSGHRLFPEALWIARQAARPVVLPRRGSRNK